MYYASGRLVAPTRGFDVGNTTGAACSATNARTPASENASGSDAKYSSNDFSTKTVGADTPRYGETGKRGYLAQERVAHRGRGDGEEKVLVAHHAALKDRFFFALRSSSKDNRYALVEQAEVHHVHVLLQEGDHSVVGQTQNAVARPIRCELQDIARSRQKRNAYPANFWP